MTCTEALQGNTMYSRFTTSRGWDECMVMVGDVAGDSVEDTCELLYDRYIQSLYEHGLSAATLAFSRIHVSDIANQRDTIKNSRLYSFLNCGAVSMVEQAPLCKGPISVHSYHIVPGNRACRRWHLNHDCQCWRNGSLIHGENYRVLWLANYDGRNVFDGHAQTEGIFDAIGTRLGSRGMDLRHNTVRTWIYVRDIDNHYLDMAKARLKFFRRIGLTDKTRYIASTGIEGKAKEVDTLVSIDSLSIGGLEEEQIVRMEVPENMPPTIHYGVTFERGLRIRFGDRSHIHVSGTASIDRDGKVMHVGNARRQTERTLDNVSALLFSQDATLDDMMYLYVYVRDPASSDTIRTVVERRVPAHVPVLFLRGAVCRPDWLVEIEGEGRIPDNSPYPDFL